MELKIKLAEKRKQKWQSEDEIVMGKFFTDHMFEMDYNEEKGWHNPTIKPYENFSVDPAALVFHYGQAIYEGMKAFKTKDDDVNLFRPLDNFIRMNKSCDRMMIPNFDPEMMVEYISRLVDIDRDWVPKRKGNSLYLRPFIIATEAIMGIQISKEYKFAIIMTPAAAVYSTNLDTIDIYVDTKYVRAVRGGTGEAKTGGNYAGTLKAQKEAYDKGYKQVLWLDALERKYIEEAGTMNVMFVIDDVIYTPSLSGSILDGITRKSLMELLKIEGFIVKEEKISIEKLYKAGKEGRLSEAFGVGTAVVVTPIQKLHWNGEDITASSSGAGKVAKFCYDNLVGIQMSEAEDVFSWVHRVEKTN